MTSGDRFVLCDAGHQHWGAYGAAGLFLASEGHVLLQHRALWSHHGGTWGIPGGALTSDESPRAGALREVIEEAGLDTAAVEFVAELLDDHGGWTYTTIIARAPHRLPVVAGRESIAVEWVLLDDLAGLDLHPGFAVTLRRVRDRLSSQ